jgi:hypothetical protein
VLMPGSSGIDFLMFVLLIPSNVIMLRCRFAACEFVRGGLFPPPAAGAAEAGGGLPALLRAGGWSMSRWRWMAVLTRREPTTASTCWRSSGRSGAR